MLLKLNFFKFCKALSRRAVQYILMIYDSKYIYIYLYKLPDDGAEAA